MLNAAIRNQSLQQAAGILSFVRRADGIAMAKSRGIHLGRKPALSQEQIQELKQKRQEGILIRELMTEYGISKASVYRFISPTVVPI